MAEEIFELIDMKTGAVIKNNDDEILQLDSEANKIRDEFAKISKHKLLGRSMQELLEVELFILDDTEKPEYELRVFGRGNEEVKEICKIAIDKFIVDKHYAFHKYHNQLKRELSRAIGEELNALMDKNEFWCSTAEESITGLGVQIFLFYVIKFDRNRLDNDVIFNTERHPLLEKIRIEWELEFGKFFNMHKKINYNELFRRASAREHFLYYYQDDFNALSAMKYENESKRLIVST